MPQGGMPRAEYRKAKFGSVERGRQLDARVAAEGQGEGIEFAFERMLRTPNTLAAHRLIALAQRQGAGQPVVDELFRAYFEEGKDVGDPKVLEEIAKRSEEHTSELQSQSNLVCRLLLEKKKDGGVDIYDNARADSAQARKDAQQDNKDD